MVTPLEFNERVLSIQKQGFTRSSAYEIAEKRYFMESGQRRYKNYESFRRSIYWKLKFIRIN